MKKAIICKGLLGMFLVVSIPECLRAEGKPASKYSISLIIINSVQDTIPPPSKSTVSEAGKNADKDVIKVIPKPRRQPIPVPVNVKVKPIIHPIIKPVIKPLIKPVISIGH